MAKRIINSILRFFYPLFKHIFPFDLYAYLGVGAANTFLNILIFAILYQFVFSDPGLSIIGVFITSYTLSLLVAFLATTPTGFWLLKEFAFNRSSNNENTQKEFGKYFIVVLQGLASDYLILKGLIVFAGIYPTVAKVISTVIVLTINFLLQKYYTFNTKNSMRNQVAELKTSTK